MTQLLLFVSIVAQLNPTGTASATGTCNVANTGNNSTATVTCYNVDRKLADQVGQLVAASKRDAKALAGISTKLDALLGELRQPSSSITVTQQAPNGINIGPGANVANPQVFNSGPPPAVLRFTEEVSSPSDGQKVLTVRISTNRSIPGAVIGIVFSGPFQIDGDKIGLKGATITQFNWSGLARSGMPLPNSLAVSINLPAAFMPSQELSVSGKITGEVHVLEIAHITQ